MLCLAGLPADTLQGHRDRFQEQFKKYDLSISHSFSRSHSPTQSFTHSVSMAISVYLLTPPPSCCRLKSLFYRSSNLQYFKRLIQIPQLPEVRKGRPDWTMSHCGALAVTEGRCFAGCIISRLHTAVLDRCCVCAFVCVSFFGLVYFLSYAQVS